VLILGILVIAVCMLSPIVYRAFNLMAEIRRR
jgi:hypothetical protein